MYWNRLSWEQIGALDRQRCIPILPVGAVEAHGPHLPLCTDDIISEAMAESACEQLQKRGLQGVILPTWSFNPAAFAGEFPGTFSFSPGLTEMMFRELAQALRNQGWPLLAIANSHFDPTHLDSLKRALRDLPLAVAFPDLTRGKNARRLTAEFQSGACHAGQYETSIVLARRPEFVRDYNLPEVPQSLVEAMLQGKSTFGEAGGPQAYFGTPAQASPDEGHQTIRELGLILTESILEQRQALENPGSS